MKFGPWEIPESDFVDCAERMERAKQIKGDRVGPLNANSQTAKIFGRDGSPYQVSMAECDCSDFQRRGLPCKHMIRLALELGYSIEVPQFDPYSAADFDVEEEISRLIDRWKSGVLTLDALSKCSSALRASASKSKRRPGRPKKK